MVRHIDSHWPLEVAVLTIYIEYPTAVSAKHRNIQRSEAEETGGCMDGPMIFRTAA